MLDYDTVFGFGWIYLSLRNCKLVHNRQHIVMEYQKSRGADPLLQGVGCINKKAQLHRPLIPHTGKLIVEGSSYVQVVDYQYILVIPCVSTLSWIV